MKFAPTIINWYQSNKRDLPWRHTKDPYKIWISEIILQQTRVNQGLKYYLKFIEHFPKVADMALASEDEVLKLWQGLGYYSRARNLHATAKIIHKEHKNCFPDNYNELLKLKGVGPYTAAAIASFAYNEAQAVVDGNVFRLLSRYYGIHTPINSTEGQKEFAALAKTLLDHKQPGTYNQAIMEFGAMQCKIKQVDCEACPLKNSCKAYASNWQDVLPIKIKKTKVKNRYFDYFIISHKKEYLLQQRLQKDIWIKLYEFPMLESDAVLEEKTIMKSSWWAENIPQQSQLNQIKTAKVHKLSHQHIHARFWYIESKQKPDINQCISVAEDALENYAVPKLIADFLP